MVLNTRFFAAILSMAFVTSTALGWGQVGHRASGYVAEAYLTPQAAKAVQVLLKRDRMADAAVWADTIRGNDKLKHVASYHYDGIPEGMKYIDYVGKLSKEQIARGGALQAVLVSERELEDPKLPMARKETAIRFLIHFIGDMHQPLHSGRAEDKGGNAIRLNWFGYDGSLHSVWDTGLILSGHPEIFNQRTEGDQSLEYANYLLQTYGKSVQPVPTRDNPRSMVVGIDSSAHPGLRQNLQYKP